jgi:hypothetical protein
MATTMSSLTELSPASRRLVPLPFLALLLAAPKPIDDGDVESCGVQPGAAAWCVQPRSRLVPDGGTDPRAMNLKG